MIKKIRTTEKDEHFTNYFHIEKANIEVLGHF